MDATWIIAIIAVLIAAYAILSLPLALVFWTWPTPGQWLIFVIAGVLGSAGDRKSVV